MTTIPSLPPVVYDLAGSVYKDPSQARAARLAMAVLLHSPAGKRALAVSSGLHHESVLDFAPWVLGSREGFLTCTETGTRGPLEEDPKLTRWVVQADRSFADQSLLTFVEVVTKEEVPEGETKDLARAPATGPQTTGTGDDLLKVLDPSLDCWSDGRSGTAGCGTPGWALTLLVLTGHLGTPEHDGRLVIVTAAEVRRHTGLGERAARVLMQRMAGALVASRERGRLVFVPELLQPGAMDTSNDRAQRRSAAFATEAAAYGSTEAIEAKYERRSFLAGVAECQPDLTPADAEALWAQVRSQRAAAQEALAEQMQALWDDQDPATVPQEPPLAQPEPISAEAWAGFLALVRAT